VFAQLLQVERGGVDVVQLEVAERQPRHRRQALAGDLGAVGGDDRGGGARQQPEFAAQREVEQRAVGAGVEQQPVSRAS